MVPPPPPPPRYSNNNAACPPPSSFFPLPDSPKSSWWKWKWTGRKWTRKQSRKREEKRDRSHKAPFFSPAILVGKIYSYVNKSLLPTLDNLSRRLPNQQRTLNKLPTELQYRNFVNKHRLSIQIGAKCAKMCAQCVLHIPTELPFCLPPLLVGWTHKVYWKKSRKINIFPSQSTLSFCHYSSFSSPSI